ncbi:MAG: cupin domain-containing protein [Candidatus Paceibacterota bacterium]
MKGFISNIEKDTLENKNFRKVLYTGKHSQLVLMSISPKEEIGEEIHTLDQFFRIESGVGLVVIDDVSTEISDGSAIIVPAGAKHNVINISDTDDLKLYTIYSPPEHKDQVIHSSKEEAMADTEDEFDGKTTE